MTEYRVERDTMGEVRLPKEAYYGAQTQRAVENFPVSGQTAPPELIHALRGACPVIFMIDRQHCDTPVRRYDHDAIFR